MKVSGLCGDPILNLRRFASQGGCVIVEITNRGSKLFHQCMDERRTPDQIDEFAKKRQIRVVKGGADLDVYFSKLAGDGVRECTCSLAENLEILAAGIKDMWNFEIRSPYKKRGS